MGGNANMKKITREGIQEASRVRVQFNTRWTSRLKFRPSFILILAHTQTLLAFAVSRRPSIPSIAPPFFSLSVWLGGAKRLAVDSLVIRVFIHLTCTGHLLCASTV